ncbi:MAG: tRNA (adenosine(37)-N6)-threonylcarbamoyltransferase complex dimerization subunit type 1 TsaB [Acidimicrobiales bacterium]
MESATELAGVALADHAGVLATVTASRRRRHCETIAPSVQFACRQAEVSLSDIDAVAVDVGPGLFTGLRVGLATAKALAFALDVPVVVATSLEVLAHGAARYGARGAGAPEGLVAPGDPLVVPVVDARRGEVFSARFRCTGTVAVQLGDDALSTPESLAVDLAALGEPCVCVGDGARRYAEILQGAPGVRVAGPGAIHPDVGALATLGVDRLVAGATSPAEAVVARYLRQADVRINWEQRLVPRPGSGT